jgi:hypothetical protein
VEVQQEPHACVLGLLAESDHVIAIAKRLGEAHATVGGG